MTSASFPMRRDDGAPAAGPQVSAGGPRLRDALPPGTLVGGGYRIERTLGQGGFGIVYLAIDLALQRPVAIKEFLPVHLALRGEGLQIALRETMHRDAFGRGLTSFLREARLLAQFDHPSLVRVYRFWEENQTAYMAMPYYEGPTLAAARQAMLRPPEEGWLRDQLLLPLIGALETLHEGHCLHRDVSPGNILLLPDGRPLLLDFGSARRVVGDMTQPLTAIVNPAYAAIEQYAESPNLPQGPWTDVYGLACVAYYVLSGRAPAPATVRAVNDAALMPMAEVGQLIGKSFPNLHYSPAFLAALDRALALRPNERPQSAAALREALISPHVQPDLAIEETRRAPVPPPVDEIRLPSEPPAGDNADARAAGEAGDEDELAIRATIQAALGEIADWPTIAPVRRGQSVRIEPVLGAGRSTGEATPATPPSVANPDAAARRTAPPAKPVHLAVVAGADPAKPPAEAGPPRRAPDVPMEAAANGDISPSTTAAPAARPPEAPIDPALAAVPGDDAGLRRPAGGRARGEAPPRQEPRWLPPQAEAPPPIDEPIVDRASNPVVPASAEAYPATRPEARIARPVPLPEAALPTPGEAGTAERSAERMAADTPPVAPSTSLPVAADLAASQAAPDAATPSTADAAATADQARLAPPPMADVVSLDRFSASADDAAASQTAAPDDEWRPRRRGGGLLWATAAVIAAALIGGGLWYAPDLGRSALAWLGLPGSSTLLAARDRAPAPSAPATPASTPTTDETATPSAQLAQRTLRGADTGTATPRIDTTNGSGTGSAATSATDAEGSAGPDGGSQATDDNGAAQTATAAPAPAPAATAATAAPAPAAPPAPAPADQGNGATPAPHIDTAAAPSSRSATHTAATHATNPTHSAARKPVAPSTRVAQSKPSYPPTARAACGDRHNFSLYYCMKAQCRLARYASSTECIRLREDDDVE